ncbi:MAG: hypothetical protein FJ035_05730 [Chloroflexi bacterium]|nr:hypothetical protein [Chloroflexota bacterium]
MTWADLYRAVGDAIGADFAAIRRVKSRAFLPGYGDGRLGRLRDLLGAPPAQSVKRAIPLHVKATLKGAAGGWSAYRTPTLATGDGLAPDPRTFALQTCTVQLSIAKATRVLGYDPIPLAEAARRTASWL